MDPTMSGEANAESAGSCTSIASTAAEAAVIATATTAAAAAFGNDGAVVVIDVARDDVFVAGCRDRCGAASGTTRGGGTCCRWTCFRRPG